MNKGVGKLIPDGTRQRSDKLIERLEKGNPILIENVHMFSYTKDITKKRLVVKLPENNVIGRKSLFIRLEVMPRLNYKDGSTEMYRTVNGLCVKCGHTDFNAELVYSTSERVFCVQKIKCQKCKDVSPIGLLEVLTTSDDSKNRGKEYAERQKQKKQKETPKNNSRKYQRNK